MLEKELKYFRQIKDELRAKHSDGGFAVIKDEQLLGVWQNRNDALKEGIEEYGDNPFLVKNIYDDPTNAINFSRKLDLKGAVSHV